MKLSEAIKLLEDGKIDSPRHDARELFIRIGKKSALDLIGHDAECDSEELTQAVLRRKSREPLQYIIGDVDFYRENYRVTPDCLIPRQETELLVDYAVNHIPRGKRFLDLCTGSGCIAISTLKNTVETSAVAIDISDGALRVARSNSERNGVASRIEFIESDVLSYTPREKYFAILSNPPYVSEEAYEKLEEEIYREPKIAFVGRDSGLEFYKRILENCKRWIDPCGFFAFEIGFDQGEALIGIANSHGMSCEIIKDFSGNDRVAIVKPQ